MQDPAADAAIVRQVLAREPAGYAALYDRHAAPLYAYCHSLLGDQERAAGAVGVTFMIAACQLGELREPDRLRPWLYALARNECICRASGRARPGPAGFAPADTDKVRNKGHGSQAPRAGDGEPLPAAQLSQAGIAAAALRGLSLDDREAVELCLRHQLIGLDLADVLGMPPRRAHAVVTRAAGRLRRALGPLLVACRGREDCPDLDAMLAGWDGRPAVLLNQRVRRHIRYCDTCRARGRRELPPGALAGLLAQARQPAPPSGLRDAVLREVAVTPGTAAGGDPIADLVTQRAGAFGPSGFPAPARRGNWRTGHPQQVAGAIASMAALGMAIVLFSVVPIDDSPPTAPAVVATSAAAASSTGKASLAQTGPGRGAASSRPTRPTSSPVRNGGPTRSASALKSAPPPKFPFAVPSKSPARFPSSSRSGR